MKPPAFRPPATALPPFTFHPNSCPASAATAESRMPDAGYSCAPAGPPSVSRPLPSPPHLYLNLHPNLPRAPRASAFSLTEVVIALGIFAVSMVGVLALFPVASSAGRESSEETQAAILAQTVFSDLAVSANNRSATNAWLVRGKDTFGDLLQPVLLTQPSEVAIAFDVKRRDRQDSAQGAPPIGMPLALKALQEVSTAQYSSGVNNLPTATYLSLLRIRPVSGLPGLAQVTIEISTPANVALTNRRVFSFSTLVTGP